MHAFHASTGLITHVVSQCVAVLKINRSPIVIHGISLCISLHSQILNQSLIMQSLSFETSKIRINHNVTLLTYNVI